MFNPPFYATVGNRLHNSSTLLPVEHSSGQTLQKKWMVNQRQPRTPFTAVNSSATSVHHAHPTPVVQYITAVPAAQIYIFFTVVDSVNDACCILSSLHISYLDLPSNLSGSAAKPRVTVARCKPCANPYDADDIPRHLPAGLTQYVLHAFATKSPPYHVTTDDVSIPPILIDVTKITGHQCVRGRGGAIAVLYETHWNGILRPTWERELDLQAFRHLILAY